MLSSAHDAFAERLAWAAVQVEASLSAILDDEIEAGETYRPPRLAAAMRHAALTGGKRFRPFLVIETARLFGAGPNGPVLAAAAVECVHSYSLVHDDLPAMDDDDLRRGMPTVHKAFDEATAILAGDALLTLAFDILSRPQVHPDAGVRIALTATLARAAGVGGMAGGQMLDLEAEGATLDEAAIRRLQAMKTGALIAASCEMGAVLGGAERGGESGDPRLRPGARPRLPARRRSPRRRSLGGRARQGHRQGRRPRQGHAGRPARPGKSPPPPHRRSRQMRAPPSPLRRRRIYPRRGGPLRRGAAALANLATPRRISPCR